jgi:Na+-transporting NADH:ubiquinone oxidoreductase subunit B
MQKLMKKMEPHFVKGGKFEKFYPIYEMIDGFLFTPPMVTPKAPHVRDFLDIKRYMMFVIIALIPALLFGAYNVGAQMMLAEGVKDFTVMAAFIKGFLKILPIIIVSYAVGGFWEVLFAVIRKHEINEGLLVTGILFPLVLPPSIPLWQVAVGISFGVVVGKEVFGGTGMNVLNPALTARAFLFFAYPGNISGDKVWVASDAFTGATPLSVSAAAEQGQNAVTALCDYGYNFMTMFNGPIPGSIGETSALAILIGAVFLLITRVGSWRIMLATVLGAVGTAALMNLLAGPDTNAMLSIPPHYHLVMGGFMFGTVFMTTDPVSAAATNTGKWLYGLLIGVMVILIRSVNPAYPEGMMLAILFGNVFAPLFDYYVVQANIKRRLKRAQ